MREVGSNYKTMNKEATNNFKSPSKDVMSNQILGCFFFMEGRGGLNTPSHGDLRANFDQEPNVDTEYWWIFVNIDESKPTTKEEIGGLDSNVKEPNPISQFL